jgi:hypothetical protein
MKKEKRTSVVMSTQMHDFLKKKARKEDLSISQIIRLSLRNFFQSEL